MNRRILKLITMPTSTRTNANHGRPRPVPVHNTTKDISNSTTTFLPKLSDSVFIIGGGPSLTDMDLSFITGHDVICVNKSIDLIQNPKYFITMDYSFFGKSGLTIRSVTSRAKSSHFILNRQPSYIQNINGVYVDTRNNLKYDGLNYFSSVISSYNEMDNKSGFGLALSSFCHGDNSGYCAIQFAILAGYKNIYLLGFDLITNGENKTHFHNTYPKFSYDRFLKKLDIYKNYMINSITKIKRHKDINFYTITQSALEPLVTRISKEDVEKLKNDE